MTTLYGVWRKRWYALAVMWAVCLAGWAFVATIPNQYQSSARVFVDSASLIPRELGLGTGNVLRQVDMVRRTLTSRVNLEKVLRRTELDLALENDEQIDAAIQELSNNISVASQQSDLFTISYTSSDPELSNAENADLARRVVDNLIQIFMEENVSADRDDINEAIRFFEDQLAERERELQTAEQRRAAFEEKYLGRLPGEGNINQRLRSARAQLDGVQLELAQARNSLGILQGQISSTPATIDGPAFVMSGGQQVASAAEVRVQEMERAISDMFARGWTEKHPDVIQARAQLERLRQQAEEAAAESGSEGSGAAPRQANPVYTNLRSMVFERQSQVAALSARAQRLQQAISELEQSQAQQPGIAAEQAKLNRDYEVLRSQYEQLLRSREEIRLRNDVETQTQQVRFRVVDPPSQPREPIAPNRPLYLSVVFLLGAGGGLALAFLLSQLHATYITAGQLEHKYDLAVLGAVSEIVSDQERAQNRMRLLGFLVLSVGLIAIFGALVLYELV